MMRRYIPPLSVISAVAIVIFLPTFYAAASPLKAPPPSYQISPRGLFDTQELKESGNVIPRHSTPLVVISRALPGGTRQKPSTTATSLPQLARFYKTAADESARKIHKLALTSAGNDRASFQRRSTLHLTMFSASLLGFQGILQQLAADKGQAFFDKSNPLEVTLKDTVNLSKRTLKDIDTIISKVPGVGPVLEPIVYQIKCVVDLLLDIAENVIDSVL